MIISLLAALALQSSAPAVDPAKTPPAAPATPADAKAAPAKPADDPNKPICRRQAPVGSTIEQRVCKTKAQWEAEATDAKRLGDVFRDPYH